MFESQADLARRGACLLNEQAVRRRPALKRQVRQHPHGDGHRVEAVREEVQRHTVDLGADGSDPFEGNQCQAAAGGVSRLGLAGASFSVWRSWHRAIDITSIQYELVLQRHRDKLRKVFIGMSLTDYATRAPPELDGKTDYKGLVQGHRCRVSLYRGYMQPYIAQVYQRFSRLPP